MPCYYNLIPQQTEEERRLEVEEALDRLSAGLSAGTVSVVLSPEGAVAFAGWEELNDRYRLSDVCAFNALQARGDYSLTLALQAAEAQYGVSANAVAIGGGLHSHDGGKTWGTD